MIVTANAKRYAKALFELAHEKNLIDKILAEFKSFLNLIEENSELQSFLNLPNDREHEKILSDLLKERFSELFFNFLLLLLRNKRIYLMYQIFSDFETKVDSYYNRVRAIAITALPLPEDKLSTVSREIATYLKADVRLENQVDPSIIGGIIIRLNGKMFDRSLSQQFKRLKQYLGGRINQYS